MNQELKIGKYEFYPYTETSPKDTRSLEELLDFLKAKSTEKKARRTLRVVSPRRRRTR